MPALPSGSSSGILPLVSRVWGGVWLCCAVPPDVAVLSPAVSMQSPEGGSDSAASVALHTSASAQAPVVQPVPASQQVTYAQLGMLFPWRTALLSLADVF